MNKTSIETEKLHPWKKEQNAITMHTNYTNKKELLKNKDSRNSERLR